MRKTDFSKIIMLSVIFVLIAAMALCMVSCDGTTNIDTQSSESVSKNEASADSEAEAPEAKYTISVTVVDDKGESSEFELKTSSDILADALLEAKLVEGEDGPYGLYIKYVNGIRADYDKDGAYWALSKGGEVLMTGVSDTKISDGDKFELTYTKG